MKKPFLAMKMAFFVSSNREIMMSKLTDIRQIRWPNKKIFFSCTFVLVLLIGAIGIFSYKKIHAEQVEQNYLAKILGKLSQVQSDIQAFPIKLINDQQPNLEAIRQGINTIQDNIKKSDKPDDIKIITDQITTFKQDIDSKLLKMDKLVSKALVDREYLSPNVLPFHLIAVDVIGGQPYVSVDYAGHFFPLSIGDVLTGWRLIAADFETGFAEFSNVKNQYIKISL